MVDEPLRAPSEPPLSADEPAECAVRRLLKEQLEHLAASAGRDLLGSDPEPLHDFRVAVRRARSLVREMGSALPERQARELARRLAWLGDRTNAARDLDVVAEHLRRLARHAPAWVRRHSGAFEQGLATRRDGAARALAEAVAAPDYARLLALWQRVAERRRVRPAAGTEEPTLGALAAQRVHKAASRVAKRARDLGPEPSPEALHDLRIACKKLRYLLEFFRPLVSERTVAALIRRLKDLQDDLGMLNDLAVAERMLFALAGEVAARGSGTEELLTLGFLLGEVERERAQYRATMRPALRAFVSRRNLERIRRLF